MIYSIKFCQGPDLDIRSLRLHSHSRGLASVYSSRDQTLVIQPFTYSLIPDIEAWCSKSDQYLLKSVAMWDYKSILISLYTHIHTIDF